MTIDPREHITERFERDDASRKEFDLFLDELQADYDASRIPTLDVCVCRMPYDSSLYDECPACGTPVELALGFQSIGV
jgi:hypothetical protein